MNATAILEPDVTHRLVAIDAARLAAQKDGHYYRNLVQNAVRFDKTIPPFVKDVFDSFATYADLVTGEIAGITARTYAIKHRGFHSRRTAFSRWRLLREHGLVIRRCHFDARQRHPDWPDGRASSFMLTHPSIPLIVPFAADLDAKRGDPSELPKMPGGLPINMLGELRPPAGSPAPSPAPAGSPPNANVRELLAVLRSLPELAEVATEPFAQRVWKTARTKNVSLATASMSLYDAALKSPLVDDHGQALHSRALESAVVGFVLAAAARPVDDAIAIMACLALHPEELELGGHKFAHEAIPVAMREGGRTLPDALELLRATLARTDLRGRELRLCILDELRGKPVASEGTASVDPARRAKWLERAAARGAPDPAPRLATREEERRALREILDRLDRPKPP